jgi:4-hydroxybenzoate polyprenyltransferase
MTNSKNSKLLFLGIYPKCPFYKPLPVFIILVLISFGTWGIYYLNFWVALGYLIYSMAFYFLLMPFTMCKYCYFKVKETVEDDKSSVENWAKSGLHLHVGQKNWTWAMFIVWALPMVLTIVSFFIDFSVFAVIALIGFVALVIGNYLFMVRVKCPSCPIREECHSSF